MTQESIIIEYTKNALASYNTTSGRLTVEYIREYDKISKYVLGLNYPNRYGVSIECPYDFKDFLQEYFREHGAFSGISVTVNDGTVTFDTLTDADIVRKNIRYTDHYKLQEMRFHNKIMNTGRPGESDYNPNSTTPLVSDAALHAYECALSKKYNLPITDLDKLGE